MRRRFPTIADDRGAALVEFALSSILFFTVLFGVMDFGLAIWRYNMTADLAQEGVRWASVHGSHSTSPASTSDVQTYVQSRALGMSVTVTTTSVNGSRQCTATSVNPSTLSEGSGICVLVQTWYTRGTVLIPVSSLTLHSQAQMMMAR